MKDLAAPNAAVTVKVTVAAGHTIVLSPAEKFGPGKGVDVPAGEVADLIARGVIVDPDAPPAPAVVREGATVTSADGTSMVTKA